MRVWLICLLFAVSLMGVRPVVADDAGLSDLKQWVGKYPDEKINSKALWDNSAFRSLLSGLMKDNAASYFYKELATGVGTPVEAQGDLVKIFVCRKHDCLYNAATLFADTKDNKLSICWHRVEDERDTWLSTGQIPKPLEYGDCAVHEGFDSYKTYHKD